MLVYKVQLEYMLMVWAMVWETIQISSHMPSWGTYLGRSEINIHPSILDDWPGYHTILIVFNINTWCCWQWIELANGMFFSTLGRVLGLNCCIVNAKINCLFNKNFWWFFEERMEHKEPFLLVPFVFSFPKEAKRGK
jgi:hypothetical protein